MAFQLPKPVNFAAVTTKTAADAIPSPKILKAKQRRMTELRGAAEVLTVLPGPGESLHCLQTGQYDLTALIAVLLDRFGPAALKIATLAFNRKNTTEVIEWLDAGKVTAVDLLCSVFFREHNGELFRSFKAELHKRKGRLAADRNHCKVVCLSFTSGERLILEGSANLRTNHNREQFSLIHDAALHEWHAAWISQLVTKHESDESPN